MGFFVLIGFLVYVAIALFVTKLMAGWKIKLITLLIFALIPTWDIPFGLWEFNKLCKTEAKRVINKTVTLSGEYFLKPGDYTGDPKYPAKGGELNYSLAREKYSINYFERTTVGKICDIEKLQTSIVEKTSGDVLGSATSFNFKGCWFKNWAVRNFANPSVSKKCPSSKKTEEKNHYHSIVYDVFIKSHD